MNDFGHQLPRSERGEDILPDGFVLHSFGEVFGYFVVYIGIHQGTADFFNRFCYIDFCDFPSSREVVQCFI